MRELVEIDRTGGAAKLTITAADLIAVKSARNVSDQLDARLSQFADEFGEQKPAVNIDFRELNKIASEGINGILAINRKARVRGLDLILCNVGPTVRDVFRITRCERLLRFDCSDVRVSTG